MAVRNAGAAALAATLLLAACDKAPKAAAGAPPAAAPPQAARPATAPWVGTYTRAAPATLRITPAPDGALDVAIDGAGPPRGDATAADCSLRARGRPVGDRLEAPVTPGPAGELSVSAAEVQAHGWRASLTRTPQGAVAVRTVYDACGLGADLDGLYLRSGGSAAIATAPRVAAPPPPQGPRMSITDSALGGVPLGASPAQVQARFGGDRLRIADDGAFTRFDIVGANVSVGFDGEGRELNDGGDSLAQAGRTVGWDALRPDLKVTFLQTASPDFVTGDGVRVGMPLARASDRLGPATVRREQAGGATEEWATFATDGGGSGVAYAVSAPGGGLAGTYGAGPAARTVRPDAVIARIRVRAPLP